MSSVSFMKEPYSQLRIIDEIDLDIFYNHHDDFLMTPNKTLIIIVDNDI